MIKFEFDITSILNTFDDLARNYQNEIAKTLNNVAFNYTRADISEYKYKTFNIKNRFVASEKSTRINRATVKDLSVEFYENFKWWGYQYQGGVELPNGQYLAIPNNKAFKSLGVDTTKRSIPNRLKIGAVMSLVNSKGKIKGQTPFIIEGKGVFLKINNKLNALYFFVKKVSHDKKELKYDYIITKDFANHFINEMNKYHRSKF